MKKQFLISLMLLVAFVTLQAQDQSKQQKVHEFSKRKLLKMNSIFDLLKDVNPSVDYSKYISRSFDVSVNISGVEYTETGTGGEFSQKQKDLISKATTGTRLYFEKIGVLKEGEHELSLLSDFILKLKE